MSETKRPIGVTILAILAAIAAIVAFYSMLQFLGILPFSLGPLDFFGFNLLGALFAGLLGLIYIWVLRSLWNLRPEGWLFVVALSVINLIFAVLSILGSSSLQALLPTIVINGIILLYCLRPGIKDSFNVPEVQAETAELAHSPTASSAPHTDSAAPLPPKANQPPAAEAAAASAAIAAMDSRDETVSRPEPEQVAEVAEKPPAEEKQVTPSEPDTPAAAAKTSRKIQVKEIEGIGPTYAATLADAEIHTTEDLLKAGASPSDRKKLAQATGLSPTNLLKWLNMADLMRVPGIGEEYSELLEIAGVDTVKELRTRNPNNLHKALEEASSQTNKVRRHPAISDVERWVAAAKELEPILTY